VNSWSEAPRVAITVVAGLAISTVMLLNGCRECGAATVPPVDEVPDEYPNLSPQGVAPESRNSSGLFGIVDVVGVDASSKSRVIGALQSAREDLLSCAKDAKQPVRIRCSVSVAQASERLHLVAINASVTNLEPCVTRVIGGLKVPRVEVAASVDVTLMLGPPFR
jgi:hypothetical protein